MLLCSCVVHPLHHRVFNEDRYSPKDKRGEEVQVNIIPCAMQMSVRRKNKSWSTTYVKAATPHTRPREEQWALLEIRCHQRKLFNLRMAVGVSNCLWEEHYQLKDTQNFNPVYECLGGSGRPAYKKKKYFRSLMDVKTKSFSEDLSRVLTKRVKFHIIPHVIPLKLSQCHCTGLHWQGSATGVQYSFWLCWNPQWKNNHL